MDVSADLTELGRTPVAVVCAGAKSILDIPRTLEVLETQARCTAFPAPPAHTLSRLADCRPRGQTGTPDNPQTVKMGGGSAVTTTAYRTQQQHSVKLQLSLIIGSPVPAQRVPSMAELLQLGRLLGLHSVKFP